MPQRIGDPKIGIGVKDQAGATQAEPLIPALKYSRCVAYAVANNN
jgi:hypothetical protein